MYAVQTADTGDLAALSDAARGGRAEAMARRRALSAGRSALGPAHERVRTGTRDAAVPAVTSNGQAPPPADTPVATNGATAPAAANGATAPAAANGATAPAVDYGAPNGVAAAHLGRNLSMERRRRLSQGKQALGADTVHANGSAPPAGGGQAPPATAPAAPHGATDGVGAAHLGRNLSMERRRRLSQGKQALSETRVAPANGAAPTGGGGQVAAQAGPSGASAAADGLAAAHLGRTLSMARRRQLSQGKQALSAAPTAPGPPVAAETTPAPPTSAGTSRPQREGKVVFAPKVTLSPTHGGQRVTGLRIGPGMRVTGDEAGNALPVSGSQYLAGEGATPVRAGGPKVGLMRTPQGLVVSGTTVRNKVAITGDEFGEHLPITGEADQKLHDDVTPRRDDTYRSAQFPRRSDPHGATALGTRLARQAPAATPRDSGRWYPLETTDGGLAVTGTAVGRSGRVTGNEAGACRPLTGDQYQGLASASSECGGTGGGTAPAAHLNRARLDPATGGKVTVAQTWAGQRITGPGIDHRPNVTGDEPGSCRPVTGTPYQGPTTAFGWCEPDEGDVLAGRLDPRPHGVAVTGDVPMHAKAVTGTERGGRRSITGTPYYGEPRPAEAAADDWTGTQAFPVALARRIANSDGDGATQESDGEAPPASSVDGRITGSFASGEGKVTGNNEFLFRARPRREAKQSVVTGEGSTEGRTVTGSAWTSHDRVTGTEGYIAAGRNPSEGGGAPHGWAGAAKFRDRATPEGPRQNVTGLSGWSPKAAARVTLSGGAQG